MSKITNYKLGPLNINYIVKKYSEKYIKKGKKNDYILENTLYWKFRDFIFKNIMVQNEIYVNINKLEKNIVKKLFIYYTFKKLPSDIVAGGFKQQIKKGWNGWILLDVGYNNTSKNKKILKPISNKESNINKLYREYLTNHIIKDKNSSLLVDDLWNDFKEWWFDITEKEYPPVKKNFLKYAELNYFKKPLINEPNFKGWDGFDFN